MSTFNTFKASLVAPNAAPSKWQLYNRSYVNILLEDIPDDAGN